MSESFKVKQDSPKLAMTWTTDKPTQSGNYWYRGDNNQAVMVYVDNTLAIEQGQWHVSELKGEWAGPLEPPTQEVS